MDKNVKTVLIIGGIILAAIIILPQVFGVASGWGMMGPGMMGGMMGPGMMGGFGYTWLMPILWILFLGLIIWVVVALVRGITWSGSTDSSRRADSALEILQKRYAHGEINKEEYEEKKKDLT